MSISLALTGHGVFVYNATETIERYAKKPGDPKGLTQAFAAMGFKNAWVRLFGVSGPTSKKSTQTLVDALRGADIEVAGWGYCHGADWKADLQSSIDQCAAYALTAFVADVEPGNSTSAGKTEWSRKDLKKYLEKLAGHFGVDNIGVSTWPVPKIQDKYDSVALMELAAPLVGMFAPQAYWMHFPKKVHYDATGFKEKNYPRDDPSSFVRLVVDAWRQMGIDNPLVVTGQAYWGEGGPDRDVIEAKMVDFASTFDQWHRLAGFNWWHAGGEKAMSDAMIATLMAARLDAKPYG